MITTTLDEVVNGWTLTLYGGKEFKQVFIYERLIDAQQHRKRFEDDQSKEKLDHVKSNIDNIVPWKPTSY